jgi:phage host-nuclease inhibitor protein Gam
MAQMNVDANYALLVNSYIETSDELRRLHRHEVAIMMDAHRKAHEKKDAEIARLTDENQRLAKRLEEMATTKQDQLRYVASNGMIVDVGEQPNPRTTIKFQGEDVPL